MSMNNNFTIKQIAGDNNNFTFNLVGAIDAHADTMLGSLTQIPANSYVLLDFSQVERVNSMGLSLLLKVFENWEKQKTRIEVQNLDRMVSMLFKITGLGRFIKTEGAAAAGTAESINPEPPRHVETKAAAPVAHVASDKLNFVASMQSGQQLTGWYLLNTYLQRRMKKAIHFEQTVDTPNPDSTDLLFAKPFEASLMIKRHGFIPVMRPSSEADEVVILTRSDDTRTLADYANVCVSTATESSFVYLLGRFLCDENGLDSSKLTFDFSGNEIKALQTLIRKKADLAFMLKKTYEGLSSFSKNSVRKLDESQTDFACHLFLVAPHIQNQAEALGEILTAMTEDDQGKQILQDIQIQGWSKPEEGEVQMLQMVYDRYRG
ncbi:PhnD/SsuA/transferrin family substrate-binding protein [Methylovulum psychrotolerans]|uniref:PhnD/SsuA/transferrin family substrate-binding protein n=1 Tax=Methylovulum psychrotolerans TaxID=1704499 RepID=UPI001BFFB954|nr:PhnD/SsuA/transferrin family substrate-binding protein [Methylovulum psychrotolerans]MBT9096289.1 PhnD/SsuA/transferrin family substrate-binding protein [Methylovulum psychrotolerans]